MKQKLVLSNILIEKMSHDGRGIARINGKTTFVTGALPNEIVTLQYTKRKRDFDEACVESIQQTSTDRANPPCPHYATCGGCSLQHLSVDAQITYKQTMLLEILAKMAHVQPQTVLAPITAESFHYRQKARLSVRYVTKKGQTLVGFREKSQPRYIAQLNTCLVLNAKIAEQIKPLAQLIDTLDDPHSIAQIEAAAGDDAIAFIVRNLSPLSESDKQAWQSYAIRSQIRIFLQPSGPASVHLFYPPGDEWLTYALPSESVKFKFHPTDFTQVNAVLNRAMVSRAMELLQPQPTDNILDLFCGLGNFSLPIAKRGASVVGIEGSEAMVLRATDNATYNNLSNAQFFCANLEDATALKAYAHMKFNKVLLDPPRTGAQVFVRNIDLFAPQSIVYVSCNPMTLARDTAILVQEKGYKLIAAGVMDMFPHTSHVESIALFALA